MSIENEAKPDEGALAFFGGDHRACDEQWAEVESAEDGGDAAIGEAWTRFDQRMRRHFDMEEQVLFPAFEEATGMTQGPTSVMRYEHQQMRAVLDRMAHAASRKDWGDLLDQGDTLLMLTQQHNVKEEGMLYPMCDAHLARAWAGIAGRLGRY